MIMKFRIMIIKFRISINSWPKLVGKFFVFTRSEPFNHVQIETIHMYLCT